MKKDNFPTARKLINDLRKKYKELEKMGDVNNLEMIQLLGSAAGYIEGLIEIKEANLKLIRNDRKL